MGIHDFWCWAGAWLGPVVSACEKKKKKNIGETSNMFSLKFNQATKAMFGFVPFALQDCHQNRDLAMLVM